MKKFGFGVANTGNGGGGGGGIPIINCIGGGIGDIDGMFFGDSFSFMIVFFLFISFSSLYFC